MEIINILVTFPPSFLTLVLRKLVVTLDRNPLSGRATDPELTQVRCGELLHRDLCTTAISK